MCLINRKSLGMVYYSQLRNSRNGVILIKHKQYEQNIIQHIPTVTRNQPFLLLLKKFYRTAIKKNPYKNNRDSFICNER